VDPEEEAEVNQNSGEVGVGGVRKITVGTKGGNLRGLADEV